jgi:hypothetical protein
MADHYTAESDNGFVDATLPNAVEEARRKHHLASADPDIDGTLTGPAHEAKYGLERAESSAALWTADGVHPIENGALVKDDAESATAPTGGHAAPEEKK